jgi:hypothetical protein
MTLSDIDNATEGLCACGCEAKIDDGSRSTWFASEICQLKWHVGQQGGAQLLTANSAALRIVNALDFRRWCERCHAFRRPVDRPVVSLCGACGCEFDRHHFDWDVWPCLPHGWQLTLDLNGRSRQMMLSLASLSRARDPIRYAGSHWELLTRALIDEPNIESD